MIAHTMYHYFLIGLLTAMHLASAQDNGTFNPPPELMQHLKSHLPPDWTVARVTNQPKDNERGWTALPTLYYIRLEGPTKWKVHFYSGPPPVPEHFWDERPEYVAVYVFSSHPLPAKKLQFDVPNSEVLWTAAPYQAIGSTSANFTWLSWRKDLKIAFAEGLVHFKAAGQAGTGHPATKPADKSRVKNQPP